MILTMNNDIDTGLDTDVGEQWIESSAADSWIVIWHLRPHDYHRTVTNLSSNKNDYFHITTSNKGQMEDY